MARNVFVVNATQVNAQGVYSKLNGYPKNFDSDSYGGNVETALRRAKAAYHAQLATNYATDGNSMQTVTLCEANGREIMRDSEGSFPTPEPEPEAEQEG